LQEESGVCPPLSVVELLLGHVPSRPPRPRPGTNKIPPDANVLLVLWRLDKLASGIPASYVDRDLHRKTRGPGIAGASLHLSLLGRAGYGMVTAVLLPATVADVFSVHVLALSVWLPFVEWYRTFQ
jgi:hypothetical protein